MSKDLKIFIIDKDNQSVAIIENYLKEISYKYSLVKATSLDEVNHLTDDEALNVFIIDVSDNIENYVDLIDEFEETHPNCKFVIASDDLKTDYIIRFLRKSKKDFVEKPIIKTSFLKILNEIIEKLTSEQDFSGHGKLITVFSNKGGLGKTTIAVNLAKELANSCRTAKTVIVDMNMFLGDVSTFLDINPPYDIKFIADKADSSNIVDLAAQYDNSNFYVIADSINRDYRGIDKENIIKLFNALRKYFRYIVVDCSSAITMKTKYLLDFSDVILLISEANLPTLSNCKKCIDFFNKIHVSDKVELVINRYSSEDDCTIQDVEYVLQKDVMTGIPNDWQSVSEAINKGLTIGECFPDSLIHKAYLDLTRLVIKRLCR